MVIFGIIACNLLKGMNFYCDTSKLVMSPMDIETLIITKQDCFDYGGGWRRKLGHFDNVFDSTTNMLVIAQVVNWAALMYSTVNSKGPDLLPGYKEGSNPYILCSFFMFFIMFGAFFVMNLFVGVIISAFNRETERLGKNFLLTSQQKKWMQTKMLTLNVKPQLSFLRPEEYYIRQVCFDIVSSNNFEIGIMIAIVLNTLCMTVYWSGIDPSVLKVIEIVNYVFLTIFCIEATMKLVAYKLRYFKDKWNRFDFGIVAVSLGILLLSELLNLSTFSHSISQVVRTVRIFRMFKLFRGMKRL